MTRLALLLALLPLPAAAAPSDLTACAMMIAEADAHAIQVVPDWPLGSGAAPTDEQVDAIFAADGDLDPDAMAAIDLYARAMDEGCW